MTIKEMENRSGMTRANIRFYESEGLLNPKRAENGYRDYAEEDLDVLKRIKLLRELGISLEEIKKMHSGEHDLQQVLKLHINKLDNDKNVLETSQEVCRIMDKDGVSYQTLDAQHYLDALEYVAQQISSKQAIIKPEIIKTASNIIEKDVLPKVKAPWKRYFARTLDMALYSLAVFSFLSLVLNVNTSNEPIWGIVETIISIFIMWAIEPVLLSLLGTTFGKWILGISVTDEDGQKLSYEVAKRRTTTLFWYGLACYVPALHLWRLWISYADCNDEKTLAWEEESELVLRDRKKWRIAAYVASYIFLITVEVCAVMAAEAPKHRGALTVEEFSENYNRMARYLGVDTGKELDEKGKWQDIYGMNTVVYMSADGTVLAPPEFEIVEENGEVVEVGFCLEKENSSEWGASCSEQMIIAALAYIGAQKEIPIVSNERSEIAEYIGNHAFEDFELIKAGIKMTCDVEYEGFENMDFFVIPIEGEDNYYRLQFKMEKLN